MEAARRASPATPRSDRLRQPDRYHGVLDWDPCSVRQVDQKPDGDGDGLVKLCSSSMSAVMMWTLIGSIGAVMGAASGK